MQQWFAPEAPEDVLEKACLEWAFLSEDTEMSEILRSANDNLSYFEYYSGETIEYDSYNDTLSFNGELFFDFEGILYEKDFDYLLRQISQHFDIEPSECSDEARKLCQDLNEKIRSRCSAVLDEDPCEWCEDRELGICGFCQRIEKWCEVAQRTLNTSVEDIYNFVWDCYNKLALEDVFKAVASKEGLVIGIDAYGNLDYYSFEYMDVIDAYDAEAFLLALGSVLKHDKSYGFYSYQALDDACYFFELDPDSTFEALQVGVPVEDLMA